MRFPGEEVTVAAYLLHHPDLLAQHERDLDKYPFTNSFIRWVLYVLKRAWVRNKRVRFPSEMEAVILCEQEFIVNSIPELHRVWLIDALNQVYRADTSQVTGDRIVEFLYDRRVEWLQRTLEAKDPEKLAEAEDFIHSLRTIRDSTGFTDISTLSPFSASAIQAQIEEEGSCNKFIPLGFPLTDASLRGGTRPGELVFIVAPTGKGKTAICCRSALQVGQQGYRVLYVGLDNPRSELDLRFMESMCGVAKHNCEPRSLFAGEVRRSIEENWDGLDPTKQVIMLTRKDFAGRPTANDIRQAISRIEMSRDIREYDIARGVPPSQIGKVHLVIIDYFARMAPSAPNAKTAKHEKLAEIADDLQELAMVKELTVITPAQVNRGGYGKDNPTLEDVASSFDAMHPAGLIAVFCQSAEEEKVNRFRLAWVKIRRGVDPFVVHYGMCRETTNVWEIPGEGTGSVPTTPTERRGRTGGVRETKFRVPHKGEGVLTPETYRNVKRKGLEPNPALLME